MIGDVLADMLGVLIEWAVYQLPRGCLIGGCLGSVMIVVLVWIALAATRA
jgi:hypothetical protein